MKLELGILRFKIHFSSMSFQTITAIDIPSSRPTLKERRRKKRFLPLITRWWLANQHTIFCYLFSNWLTSRFFAVKAISNWANSSTSNQIRDTQLKHDNLKFNTSKKNDCERYKRFHTLSGIEYFYFIRFIWFVSEY